MLIVISTPPYSCKSGTNYKTVETVSFSTLYAGLIVSNFLKRHPFSGLIHSVGELLHTP